MKFQSCGMPITCRWIVQKEESTTHTRISIHTVFVRIFFSFLLTTSPTTDIHTFPPAAHPPSSAWMQCREMRKATEFQWLKVPGDSKKVGIDEVAFNCIPLWLLPHLQLSSPHFVSFVLFFFLEFVHLRMRRGLTGRGKVSPSLSFNSLVCTLFSSLGWFERAETYRPQSKIR